MLCPLAMTTYGFRLRFYIHGPTLNTEEKSVEIALPDGNVVTLSSARTPDSPLSDARELQLRGTGLTSSDEATRCGERLRGAIRKSSATLHMGFDLGRDTATSGLGKLVKDHVLATAGVRVLDNVHGLVVYEEDLPVSIPVFSGQGRVLRSPTAILDEWTRQYELDPQLTAREVLAFELYSAAQREPFPRARFLTLVSVVEVLAAPRERAAEVVALVESFGKQTASAPQLKDADRRALIDSLSFLKKQSIRSACRGYVEGALGADEWRDFDRLYGIRSALAHDGDVGADLNVEGTILEGIVSRLLGALGGSTS
jgi:hypothetical protein